MRFRYSRELTSGERLALDGNFDFVEMDVDGSLLILDYHPRLGYVAPGLDDIDYLRKEFKLNPICDE